MELVSEYVHLPVPNISAAMPDLRHTVTFSPVGGARLPEEDLESLRLEVVSLASEHGMPGAPNDFKVFEGRCARLLRRILPISPHEAATEEVWSYITCGWLLDVAIWRFGENADKNRFVGHLNRNTFRRMWWRAEVLADDVDLTRLGEDELVAIMERPTLASSPRIASAIAREHLRRNGGAALMREATKRLLRLTPFVALTSLSDHSVEEVVADVFDAADAGIRGEPVAMPVRTGQSSGGPSPDVTVIPSMTIVSPHENGADPMRQRRDVGDFEEVAAAALDIARGTGRVSNMQLREVVPITSDEAREVLSVLMERGQLVRRGVKRGTHYVLPERGSDSGEWSSGPNSRAPDGPSLENGASTPEPDHPEVPPSEGPPEPAPRRLPDVGVTDHRTSDTALRRLLRRGR